MGTMVALWVPLSQRSIRLPLLASLKKMVRKHQSILPFKIERTEEPLIARAGLVLPYEMAKALKLPWMIDQELSSPRSGHGYKPSQFVMPLVLMLHGGRKKLEDLREIKGQVSLRELLRWRICPLHAPWVIG